jgi:hypothetical protein
MKPRTELRVYAAEDRPTNIETSNALLKLRLWRYRGYWGRG